MNKRWILLAGLLLSQTLGWALSGSAHPDGRESSPLAVELTATPNPVETSHTLTWTARIENNDAARTALDVQIHDSIPASVRVIDVQSEGALCDLRDQLLTCDAGDMAPGSAVSLSIEAQVLAPTGSEISNTVTTSSFSDATRRAVVSSATIVATVGSPPPPPAPPSAPKVIGLSPTCVEPGAPLTLVGQNLDELNLQDQDILIGDQHAAILAISNTGLVVETPALSEGPYPVLVAGAANQPIVRVSALCTPEVFSTEDTQAGFVEGDVLIFFKEPLSESDLEAFRAEYGLITLIEHPLLGYYYAQLDPDLVDDGVIEPLPPPVDCRTNLRTQAEPHDVVLLVDVSGTMDVSYLRPVFNELVLQMYCLVNRTSRITLMAYNHQSQIIVPEGPWAEQSTALIDWAASAIQPRKNSDLGMALDDALGYLSERKRASVEQQIMVITRGPISPALENTQAIVNRATAQQVAIHGLAFTNLFYRENQYEALRRIAQATGRDILTFDEDNMRQAVASVRCSVVYGILGQACDVDDTSESSGTIAITCGIATGIYGVERCGGPEVLSRIPRLPLRDYTTELVDRLNQDPRVDEAFFNDLLDELQADPNLDEQAWLRDIGLPRGWELFFPNKGAGVTVAVIDTGVDLSLTEGEQREIVLDGAAPLGLNFAPVPDNHTDQTGNDELGHGTAVSAIASSVIDNGVNGAGVAPNATVIALKVFAVVDGQVKASNDSMAQAIMNAFVLGVDVVNISVGCQGCSDEQEARLRKFYGRVFDSLYAQFEHPPVVVAASGNDGANWVDAPAFYDRVIAVGSINPNTQTRSAFSNYGPQLDFVAVGENTLTTLPGGFFNSPGSGTSFSAPQVAGLAALILSEQPTLSPEQVLEIIKLCFVKDLPPAGFDDQTGWGQAIIPDNLDGLPSECTPS